MADGKEATFQLEVSEVEGGTEEDVMKAVEATGFFERARQYQEECDRKAQEGLNEEERALFQQWLHPKTAPEPWWWNKPNHNEMEYKVNSRILWHVGRGCG